MAFAHTAREGLGTRSFATDRYRARLQRLPLPDPTLIERALPDAAATAVVISTKGLVIQVIDHLGLGDDPLPARLITPQRPKPSIRSPPTRWSSGCSPTT